MDDLITVIVPVYNAENTIEKTVEGWKISLIIILVMSIIW